MKISMINPPYVYAAVCKFNIRCSLKRKQLLIKLHLLNQSIKLFNQDIAIFKCYSMLQKRLTNREFDSKMFLLINSIFRN